MTMAPTCLCLEAGPSVLILDEPSTGLHAADVAQLAQVLQNLRFRGHALIVIEHHTGLLAICDQLIELGPGGGAAGGKIIAQGTARALSLDPASITGPWILAELEREDLRTNGATPPPRALPSNKPRARSASPRKKLVP